MKQLAKTARVELAKKKNELSRLTDRLKRKKELSKKTSLEIKTIQAQIQPIKTEITRLKSVVKGIEGTHNRGLQVGNQPSLNPQQSDSPGGNRNIQQNVGVVQSFDDRINHQPAQFPGASTSGKDTVSSRGTNALLLTVKKEGPNTDNSPQQQASSLTVQKQGPNNGKEFYGFGKPRDQSRDGSKPRDQSRDGSKPRDQSRDGSKPRDQSRDGSKPRDQSRDGSKPRDQSCNFLQRADEASGGSGSQSFPERGAANYLQLAPFQPTIGATPKRKIAASATEGGLRQRKAAKCGNCGQPGHKKPTCLRRSQKGKDCN